MIDASARGAWHELEARLRPYVERRVSSKADADDVLQELFVRVHRGLPQLRDGERFGPWVYGIARRTLADHARARARHPLAAQPASADPPAPRATLGGYANALAPAFDPDADPERGPELEVDLGECVALFVARLPSPYREAITLTELQGLTQAAAAELLGISHSGMKSRVQRGRDKIRAMFEQCCEIALDCRGRVVQCEPRARERIPQDCRAAADDWAARRGR